MTERNPGLDGLRGFAATVVIFYHCFGAANLASPQLASATTWHDVAARITVAILNGETAVGIFFVMSGAVLMNSLGHQSGSGYRIAGKFITDRFFRIYPPFFIAILASAPALSFVGTPPDTRIVIENLLLYSSAVHGPSWTLNAEAFATILILASCFILRKSNAIALSVFLVVVLTAARHLPPRDLLHWFRVSALGFSLGVLIPTVVGRSIAARCGPGILWLALPGMIFAGHVIDDHVRTAWSLSQVCAAVVVMMLFYGKAGAVGDFLSRPIPVFLGTISYGLYLFHVPPLILVGGLTELGANLMTRSLTGTLVMGAIVACLTIPIAWASFNWIERPSIAYGKRIFARRKRAEVVPAE